ncbi:MAG: hypothetical protein U0441_15890 [Polyangiaceae bacterium]
MADSKMKTEVLLRFEDPRTNRALVLEDDGRVAYAYLLDQERIVGDVWLYNVSEAPESEKWKDQTERPFLNPKSFCNAKTVPRLSEDASISCKWFERGVEVLVDAVLVARLEQNAKPGWSRLASRPGPLAKPLDAK